ncbi:MAG TPA: hypothetical protein VIK40_09870 [Geomonas sp.]
MNRVVIWVYAVLMSVLLATAVYADRITMKLSAGEVVYACSRQDSCPCDTLSRSKGNCGCGAELVPAKVARVADGKAYLEQRDRAIPIVGKYACPVSCKGGTISQHPGSCSCGRKMKMVS